MVKYDDKPGNDNKVYIKYVEIIDPRGNSFKFVMDMTLKSGEETMLPRKQSTTTGSKKRFLKLEYILKSKSNI